jgi:MYXO-CTERM domain-containing protein
MNTRPLLVIVALGALLGPGCDGGGGRVSRAPVNLAGAAAPDAVAQSRAPLGEVVDGYPADQERMVLVLTNLARHAAKNDCGDWEAEQGAAVKKNPLVHSHVGNIAARYTSQHMADLGCFQHESCCVLGNVNGQVQCTAPASCNADPCAKNCTGGTGTAQRYGLLGMTSFSGENIARGYPSAFDVWCGWMNSDGHRQNIYGSHSELGVGRVGSQGCGRYWTQAFGSGGGAIPRIPAASAMHGPNTPSNAANMYFAANYFDNGGLSPKRSVVVVNGHCFDLEKAWGHADNGTYQARFSEPDDIPAGCHPYYFLFVDGDAQRHTYPDNGSLFVALGAGTTCPDAYAPTQKPADCETGVQDCTEGAVQTCYTGPPGTLGLGECREGYQVCQNGFWSACRQQKLPAPEQCDGLDNNCDGVVDEGNPGADASCMVQGEWGECQKGGFQCIGGGLVCLSLQGPQLEVCDGLDNDCDGVIDDGLGSLFCGQGECFRQLPACILGVPQTCVPGEPSPEIPDNKDNDCNGWVDDGLDCGTAGMARLCFSYSLLLPDGGTRVIVPPCVRGVQTCQQDAGWSECVGEVGPAQEVCDGKDNDCNGVPDDPAELGHERCGAGICVHTGPSCKLGKLNPCEPRPAAPETCNGLDDNCNGTVDEACTCRDDVSLPCYSGPRYTLGVGPCAEGLRTCVAGQWSACEGQVTPGIEYCNRVDDNCDGTVDEDCIPLAPDGGVDAGPTPSPPDAGPGAEEPEGGCGCAAGPGGAGALPALALALGAWALRRRRR